MINGNEEENVIRKRRKEKEIRREIKNVRVAK